MQKPFGKYDIRGVFGKELDTAFAFKLGRALATFLGHGPKHRYLVGHDSRTSSIPLTRCLIAGLRQSGVQIDYIGLCSTPRMYWHGAVGGYDCSIVVTASHLAAKYNGFKICRKNAEAIGSDNGLREIATLMHDFDQDECPKVEAETGTEKQSAKSTGTASESEALSGSAFGLELGLVKADGKLGDYLQMLAAGLSAGRPLRIACDCGGGAVGVEVEGWDLVESRVVLEGINLEPDGTFLRRSPNPLDEGALDELTKYVTANQVDFGVAFDADGDRIVLVDELGKLVPPEIVTALIAGHILSRNPSAKIMYDLRCGRIVRETIDSYGGVPLQTRVGHAYIKMGMRSSGAAFAGELSGHYYWADLFNTDNAMRTLMALCNLVSEQDAPLSDIVRPFGKYAASGELNFTVGDSSALMQILKDKYSDGQHSFLDGLSVDYPSWWFNLRDSNTEPVVRLCVGAASQGELDQKCRELSAIIGGDRHL